MANNENSGNEVKVVDTPVLSIGVSDWQNSLAAAINETYSYANSSMFAAMVAGYYKDYAYRYIRPACQWLDGYVPTLHNRDTGIVSTRIASCLINGLARTIVGEKLLYKIVGDKNPNTMAALSFISKWADDNEIKKAVKNGIAFALGIGTALLKANVRGDKTVWWEAVRFDNCFYLANSSNEVKDAKFLLRNYTDTRDSKNTVQFYLVEHRFWKYYQPLSIKNPDGTYTVVHKLGDKQAMVEYQIYRANGQSLTNIMASSTGRSSVGWSEVPKEIRKLIKEDYAVIRIDEPKPLPFRNLGVEALINDYGDISIPTGSNFGRGLIIPVMDDFITYEVAEAYAIRDMYLGKGTVYVPKNLSMGSFSANGVGMPIKFDESTTPIVPGKDEGEIKFDGTNVAPKKNPGAFVPYAYESPVSGYSDKYEQIPGVDAKDQQVLIQQFNLRAQEWQLIKENCLKSIAVKWGMSPKILSSFLAQGQAQMTATQVDSEDDISIAFINLERADFKPAINRLLETTLAFYGFKHDVDIDFASPSIINKDRILDRVIKKLEAGLIDIEDAIREINPDLDEETLQAKISKAVARQKMQMLAMQSEMNEEGGFDNNYDDLGGENMNGSTSPIQ